jgi:hypothetical protein
LQIEWRICFVVWFNVNVHDFALIAQGRICESQSIVALHLVRMRTGGLLVRAGQLPSVDQVGLPASHFRANLGDQYHRKCAWRVVNYCYRNCR